MPKLRPILFVVGILLIALGIAMFAPVIVELYVGSEEWQAFGVAGVVTTFIGSALWIANRGSISNLTIQQAFILTTLSWLALVTFAAFPFVLSTGMTLSPTDAFFEAMSGLTTTGSTVIIGLDNAPPGILAWRAILQWIGGVGIIVMAMAVLPLLRVGGMQIFRLESSDNSEKILPRAQQITRSIVTLYVFLTVLCTVGYWSFGMAPAEALAHAMTTIPTGGYSTSDLSMGNWPAPGIQYIAIVFMILSSLPFVAYLQAFPNKPRSFFGDRQVQGFIFIGCIVVLALLAVLVMSGQRTGEEAFRTAAFNGISVLSGTGYASEDYGKWGVMAAAIIFFSTFVGGCTGSACGGIKIFRFQIMHAAMLVHVRRVVHPHGVFITRYKGKSVPLETVSSVMSFFVFFMALFTLFSASLSCMGLDTITSISSVATAMANVGPGLGDIVGPSGTFKSLPDAAKWVLSFAMLLGRLELFTVLVLILPRFWEH